MTALVAAAHIGSTIFVLIVLAGASVWIAAQQSERVRRRRLEEISLALGVSVDELQREEMNQRLLQLFSERFDSELLRNRLSDLCGLIRSGWDWLGVLMQAGILIGVIWTTLTGELTAAVHAWWAVCVAVVFWFISAAFSLACHLLTGRYPGEAKQGRKSLSAFIEHRKGVAA